MPENSTLFIVGDVNEEQVIEEVERAFGGIPSAWGSRISSSRLRKHDES